MGSLAEVGQIEVAVGFIAEYRDEQEVIHLPRLAVGQIRGALLDDDGAKDATEDGDGQVAGKEVDEEDPPRLVENDGAKAANGANLDGALGVEPGVLRGVLEGEVFDIPIGDGPLQFVAEVCRKGLKVADSAELPDGLVEGGRGHESSIHALRVGDTPTGALVCLR